MQNPIDSGALAPYVKQDGMSRYSCGPIQSVANDQTLTQGRRKPSQEVQSLGKVKGRQCCRGTFYCPNLVILPPVSL